MTGYCLMNNSPYCEIKGNGHNIVLLHGWGMHGGLWGEFNDLLSESFKTHALDLPGYGFSKDVENAFTLDAITDVVESYIKNIKEPVSLIGWSLGGLIAQNILKRKNIQLEKVIFIATTPSFTKRQGWESAMDLSIFKAFSNDLKTDYKKTLKRFLSLQTRGSDLAREEIRELNNQLSARGEPNIKALGKGLNILNDTDLRSNKTNKIPAMLILGDKDTLVPLSVSNEFEKIFPNLKKLVLDKTGHAPFISNPESCADKIKNFINE